MCRDSSEKCEGITLYHSSRSVKSSRLEKVRAVKCKLMSSYHRLQNVTLTPFDGVGFILGPSITVHKATLLETHPHIRPETESQRALTCLLQKRRLYYQARRKGSHNSIHSLSFSSDHVGDSQSANTTAYMADNELTLEEEKLDKTSKVVNPKVKKAKTLLKATSDREKTGNTSNLVNVDSKELAERIVNQARRRMRGKHERALTEAYMRPVRTSTPIPVHTKNYLPKVGPAKSITTAHPVVVNKHYSKTNFHSSKNSSVSTESTSTSSSCDTSTSDSPDQQQGGKKAVYPLTNYLKISK